MTGGREGERLSGGLLGLLPGGSSAQTPDLLASVLGFLDLLPGGVHGLLQTLSDLSVVGLELLQGLDRVVDEAEAGGLAAAIVRSEAEDDHSLGVGDLEDLGHLSLELRLGHTGSTVVDDIDDLSFYHTKCEEGKKRKKRHKPSVFGQEERS